MRPLTPPRLFFRPAIRPALRAAALVAVVLLGALPAWATFIGSTVTADSRYPDTSTIAASFGSVVVDAGVEYPSIFSGTWSTDVGASSLRIDQNASGNLLGSASFNGFVYTFAGAPAIASVSVDSSSTLVPYDVTATVDSIFVNYQGLGSVGPSFTLLNVTFVPEPSLLLLLLGGVALVAARPGPSPA